MTLSRFDQYQERLQGASPKYMELFARVFQTKTLIDERKYQEAFQLAETVRTHEGFKAKYKTIDDAERVTWLTQQM